ncbi:MAG: AbrB/MazE/SpoVT family DNA-binding domain-containing protein [Candidatus Altiarchaeota archaeon]|nr:AbrB/MazE/SpoVT family DNA-binding domain-containing protein [Candidatus Altiarchaeota archaeon]
MRDIGRYHKLPWKGGQITIRKDIAQALNLKNKDKVLLEYDEKAGVLKITKL